MSYAVRQLYHPSHRVSNLKAADTFFNEVFGIPSAWRSSSFTNPDPKYPIWGPPSGLSEDITGPMQITTAALLAWAFRRGYSCGKGTNRGRRRDTARVYRLWEPTRHKTMPQRTTTRQEALTARSALLDFSRNRPIKSGDAAWLL